MPQGMERQVQGYGSGIIIIPDGVVTAVALRRAFRQAAGGQAILLWFERNGRIGRTSFYAQ